MYFKVKLLLCVLLLMIWPRTTRRDTRLHLYCIDLRFWNFKGKCKGCTSSVWTMNSTDKMHCWGVRLSGAILRLIASPNTSTLHLSVSPKVKIQPNKSQAWHSLLTYSHFIDLVKPKRLHYQTIKSWSHFGEEQIRWFYVSFCANWINLSFSMCS